MATKVYIPEMSTLISELHPCSFSSAADVVIKNQYVKFTYLCIVFGYTVPWPHSWNKGKMKKMLPLLMFPNGCVDTEQSSNSHCLRLVKKFMIFQEKLEMWLTSIKYIIQKMGKNSSDQFHLTICTYSRFLFSASLIRHSPAAICWYFSFSFDGSSVATHQWHHKENGVFSFDWKHSIANWPWFDAGNRNGDHRR